MDNYFMCLSHQNVSPLRAGPLSAPLPPLWLYQTAERPRTAGTQHQALAEWSGSFLGSSSGVR